MAIIHVMTNNAIAFPVTACCPFVWINDVPRCLVNVDMHAGDLPIVTYLSHVGRCITHFCLQVTKHETHTFMVTWNPRLEQAEHIRLHAGFGFYVDADKSVLDAYEKWRQYKKRKICVMQKWEMRRLQMRDAKECRLTRFQMRKIRKSVHMDRYQRILGLLRVTEFRSPFRAGLARCVRAWVRDPQPRHPCPLSAEQLQHL